MLGRRSAYPIRSFLSPFGLDLICASRSFALLIVGETITGLSAGLVSVTAPSYVVEISTPIYKGNVRIDVSGIQLFNSIPFYSIQFWFLFYFILFYSIQ